MATLNTITDGSAGALRESVLRDTAARRRYLATAPISEKLKILEEMRDTTRALKTVRERNKLKIRDSIATRSTKSV